MLDLAARHALHADAFGVQQSQDIRIPVRLGRVQHAVHGLHALHGAGGLAERIGVIDVGGIALPQCGDQRLRAALPPLHGSLRPDPGLVEELFPGGPQHLVAGRRLDEQLVQLVHQAIGLAFVDDESEVQVVGGLAHEIDALLFEVFEGLAQLMQDRADVATDEAYRRAGTDDLHARQLCQVCDHRFHGGSIECVRLRIQRHGDVGLRRRHQVDRQAVLLEDLEGVGEKTDLVPHARAVERDQRDALLDADGLDLGRAVAGRGTDVRAFEVRRLRRVDEQRNLLRPHRQDAARMQHLGATARDLLGLIVVKLAQQPRTRRQTWVRAEHARYVRPDLEPAGEQLRGEVGARGVGAATTQQHGISRGIARDEPLRDDHGRQGLQSRAERRVWGKITGCRQEAPACRCRRALLDLESFARIPPGDV